MPVAMAMTCRAMRRLMGLRPLPRVGIFDRGTLRPCQRQKSPASVTHDMSGFVPGFLLLAGGRAAQPVARPGRKQRRPAGNGRFPGPSFLGRRPPTATAKPSGIVCSAHPLPREDRPRGHARPSGQPGRGCALAGGMLRNAAAPLGKRMRPGAARQPERAEPARRSGRRVQPRRQTNGDGGAA